MKIQNAHYLNLGFEGYLETPKNQAEKFKSLKNVGANKDDFHTKHNQLKKYDIVHVLYLNMVLSNMNIFLSHTEIKSVIYHTEKTRSFIDDVTV